MLDEKIKKSNRRKFLVLLMLMCSPVVVSYLLYFMDYKPEATNYGELLTVHKLSGKGSNQIDDTIFRIKDLHGKWVLVTVDSGNCDELCQSKLFYMRQVRLVQNKEMNRIERLWLISDDVMADPALVEKYEGTYFISARDSELLDMIPTAETQTKYIYLIDPLGNLMMRFPENMDPTKMGKDIKRLLHVSQVEH